VPAFNAAPAVINVNFVPRRRRGDPRHIAWSLVVDPARKLRAGSVASGVVTRLIAPFPRHAAVYGWGLTASNTNAASSPAAKFADATGSLA
jgi:hypothetical protein